jgi:hypothetical protein
MPEESDLSGAQRPIIVGDLDVTGNANAGSFTGDGSPMQFGTLWLREQSSDPPAPSEGMAVMWMSDGTGAGADGDVLLKITSGGATKTATLADFSAI